MPAPVMIAVLGAVSSGAGAAASIYGARRAGQGTDKALAYQTAADQRAEKLQRQQIRIADEQAAYDRRLDAYNQGSRVVRDARGVPYRQASQGALVKLGGVLGIPVDPQAASSGPTWDPSADTIPGQYPPGGGPAGGDYKEQMRGLIGDRPLTTATMLDLEPQLEGTGMSFRWSADHERPDVMLPSGEQIDFVQNMGGENPSFQWNPVSGRGSLGSSVGLRAQGGAYVSPVRPSRRRVSYYR